MREKIQRSHLTPTDAPAPHLILNLTESNVAPLPIQPGVSTSLIPGVLATLSLDSQHLLLEFNDPAINVHVDGEKAYEAAMIPSARVFSVNTVDYVFLAPTQSIVNERSAQLEFSLYRKLSAMREKEDNDRSILQATRNLSPKKRWVRVTLHFLILAMFATSMLMVIEMGKQKNSQNMDMISLDQLTKSELAALKFFDPPRLSKTLEENPQLASVESDSSAPTQNRQTPPLARQSVAQRNKTSVQKSFAKESALFQEYRLEARFDPRKATKNVKELMKRIPSGSPLSKQMHEWLCANSGC